MSNVISNDTPRRDILFLKPKELVFLLQGRDIVGLNLPRCVCETSLREGDVAPTLVGLIHAGHVWADSTKPLRLSPSLEEILRILASASHTIAFRPARSEGTLFLYATNGGNRFVILRSDRLTSDYLEIGTFPSRDISNVVQECLPSPLSHREDGADPKASDPMPQVRVCEYLRNEEKPRTVVDLPTFLSNLSANSKSGPKRQSAPNQRSQA